MAYEHMDNAHLLRFRDTMMEQLRLARETVDTISHKIDCINSALISRAAR